MSQLPLKQNRKGTRISVKAKIVLIWAVTIVLLLLRRFEVIQWSAWVIVAPVVFMITVVAVPMLIVIWIGIWRGLKIRIVNTLGHH